MRKLWMECEQEVRRKYRIIVEEVEARSGILKDNFIAWIYKKYGFSDRLIKTILKHASKNQDLYIIKDHIYATLPPKTCPICLKKGYGSYIRVVGAKGHYYKAEYFKHYKNGKIKWCYVKFWGRIDTETDKYTHHHVNDDADSERCETHEFNAIGSMGEKKFEERGMEHTIHIQCNNESSYAHVRSYIQYSEGLCENSSIKTNKSKEGIGMSEEFSEEFLKALKEGREIQKSIDEKYKLVSDIPIINESEES